MLKLASLAVLIAAISAVNLDRLRCGPLCKMKCPNGNVLDKENCPTCECLPVPIDEVKTDPENCAPVLCRMFCFTGWKKNDNGCDICACAELIFGQ